MRCRVRSPDLSKIVFERLKNFLKPICLEKDDYKQTGKGYRLEGVWEPIGVEESWALSKYPPESHFGPHFDGPTVTNFGERTLQTLVIYLNEDFEGGGTNFLDEKTTERSCGK